MTVKIEYAGSDGTVKSLDMLQPKDVSTGALETIDYAHHEIHSGNHFYIQGYVELDTAGVFRAKLVTPHSTKWSHLIFAVTSSGITSTTLDEGATGGMTGGAGVTPVNNNRNSINTSKMVFTSGVTAAVGYDLRIEDDKWGALGFKSTIGGGSSRDDELVLKQDTTYLRTFTSFTDANIIQFRVSWYEHTNRGE